jgi:hypothetical protein
MVQRHVEKAEANARPEYPILPDYPICAVTIHRRKGTASQLAPLFCTWVQSLSCWGACRSSSPAIWQSPSHNESGCSRNLHARKTPVSMTAMHWNSFLSRSLSLAVSLSHACIAERLPNVTKQEVLHSYIGRLGGAARRPWFHNDFSNPPLAYARIGHQFLDIGHLPSSL